jgi:hypothetical protein
MNDKKPPAPRLLEEERRIRPHPSLPLVKWLSRKDVS